MVPEAGRGGGGVVVEARALIERTGDGVQEAMVRREVADRGLGEGVLDEVVARDVKRVHAVHHVRVGRERRPAAEPAGEPLGGGDHGGERVRVAPSYAGEGAER